MQQQRAKLWGICKLRADIGLPLWVGKCGYSTTATFDDATRMPSAKITTW
jgi:hypothetical protein